MNPAPTSSVPAPAASAAASPTAPSLDLRAFCSRPSAAESTSVYIIGLMSGTSLDGCDAVLADFGATSAAAGEEGARRAQRSSPRGRMVGHHFVPMPASLRASLLALNTPSLGDLSNGGELHQSALASNALAHLYAEAVQGVLRKCSLSAASIRALGCHGQTVRHRPERGSEYTLQLGNHALLAELTGVPVVGDFRSRDVAAGGNGAPLVPAFHRAFFGQQVPASDATAAPSAASSSSASAAPAASPSSSSSGSLLVLNLGGIANISFLRADGSVLGCDTGPGNVLADLWVQRQQFPAKAAAAAEEGAVDSGAAAAPATMQYDVDGAWGASGRVIQPLLHSLLQEPYFAAAPPKSTGRDLFNDAWLQAQGVERYVGRQAEGEEAGRCYTAADVQATLIELTARSVAEAVEKYCTEPDAAAASASSSAASAAPAAPLFVCGGGAFNRLLLSRLSALLPARLVAPTHLAPEPYTPLPPEAVEGMAFAWLAFRFLQGRAGNMPAVTGAKGERVLGCYYPA